MYRITHEGDTYLARNIEFETETSAMTGGGGAITYRVDHIQTLNLGHVTHINGEPVPEHYLVPPIPLFPESTAVTVEPVDPKEAR